MASIGFEGPVADGVLCLGLLEREESQAYLLSNNLGIMAGLGLEGAIIRP